METQSYSRARERPTRPVESEKPNRNVFASQFTASPRAFDLQSDYDHAHKDDDEERRHSEDEHDEDSTTSSDSQQDDAEIDSELDAAYDDDLAQRRDQAEFQDLMRKLRANKLDDVDD